MIAVDANHMVGEEGFYSHRPSAAIKLLQRFTAGDHTTSQRAKVYPAIFRKQMGHTLSILGFDGNTILVGQFLDFLSIPEFLHHVLKFHGFLLFLYYLSAFVFPWYPSGRGLYAYTLTQGRAAFHMRMSQCLQQHD